jgi:hypothetical protein
VKCNQKRSADEVSVTDDLRAVLQARTRRVEAQADRAEAQAIWKKELLRQAETRAGKEAAGAKQQETEVATSRAQSSVWPGEPGGAQCIFGQGRRFLAENASEEAASSPGEPAEALDSDARDHQRKQTKKKGQAHIRRLQYVVRTVLGGHQLRTGDIIFETSEWDGGECRVSVRIPSLPGRLGQQVWYGQSPEGWHNCKCIAAAEAVKSILAEPLGRGIDMEDVDRMVLENVVQRAKRYRKGKGKGKKKPTPWDLGLALQHPSGPWAPAQQDAAEAAGGKGKGRPSRSRTPILRSQADVAAAGAAPSGSRINAPRVRHAAFAT